MEGHGLCPSFRTLPTNNYLMPHTWLTAVTDLPWSSVTVHPQPQRLMGLNSEGAWGTFEGLWINSCSLLCDIQKTDLTWLDLRGLTLSMSLLAWRLRLLKNIFLLRTCISSMVIRRAATLVPTMALGREGELTPEGTNNKYCISDQWMCYQ